MYEIYPISRLMETLFGLADAHLPTTVDFDYLLGKHLSVDDTRRLVAAGLLSPGDPEQLVAVLYAACETQIKERGLEPRQFAARFDGDAIEAAIAALAEALVDFSPKRHREPMRRALRKIEARIATSQPTDEELDALIDRTIAASLPEQVTSTTPSTPSQAS